MRSIRLLRILIFLTLFGCTLQKNFLEKKEQKSSLGGSPNVYAGYIQQLEEQNFLLSVGYLIWMVFFYCSKGRDPREAQEVLHRVHAIHASREAMIAQARRNASMTPTF